jgi:Secretion system C-terminal sorting domain
MSHQKFSAYLKKNLLFLCFTFIFFLTCFSTRAQTVTYTVNYTTTLIDKNNTCNVFNENNLVVIPDGTNRYTHYPVLGGVQFNGTAIGLGTAYADYVDGNGNQVNNNQGTAYAFSFPFISNYTYTMKIFAYQIGTYNTANNVGLYPSLYINVVPTPTEISTACNQQDNPQSLGGFFGFHVSATTSTEYDVPAFTPKAGVGYFQLVADPYPASSTGTAPCATVGPVTGLTTSNSTSTLNWTAYPGASSYLVTINDNHLGTITTTSKVTSANSADFCALASGDAISYTVKVTTNCGTGPTSSPYSFTSSYPVLAAPTGLTYTIPNTLSWQPVTGALSYLVVVTQEPNQGSGGYFVAGTSVSGSSSELTTGNSYEVTVAAETGCKTGPASAPISFTVPTPPSCSPPSVAVVAGGTYVVLNPVVNAVSYNVGWRNTSGVIVYQVNNIGSVITTQGYQATGVPHGSFYVVAQANCTVGGTTAWGSPYFGGLQSTAKKFPAVTMNSTEESGDSSSYGKPGMFVYPDPATTQLNIQYNTENSGKADIIILSELGNQLMRKSVGTNVGKNSFSFDIDQLPNGVYFIRLIDANNTYVKKLVVQK